MLDDLRADVDAGLAALDLPSEPAGLYGPVRYVLGGGGKRVRPALVLLAAEAFGGDGARRRAMRAALGVEVFHNFTLVHDDIMDRAASRRGRPTVHEKWDTPTAILAGDLMMGLATSLVARTEGADVAALQASFYRMVARLCEGQSLDMAFERRADVTVAEYLAMIDGKTGALLELALELGARIGGAEDAEVTAMREAGVALGRAFQIQDDLLDLTAQAAALGKTIGGDVLEGKRTFLVVAAHETAGPDRAWLDAVLAGAVGADGVSDVRERLRTLGVLDRAARAVSDHTGRAEAAFAVLPDSAAADALRQLARALATRRL